MPSLAPLGSHKNTVAPAATRNKVASPPAQRSIIGCSATVGADEAFDCSGDYDDEDIASSMEENKKVAEAAARIDFNRFDYKTQDLNKLGDAELKAHKAKMEEGFSKNAIKKGDPGFEYDKRVDFKRNNVVGPAADDSWDESDDEEDEGVEIVASSQVKSKPKGIGLAMRQEIEKDLADDTFNDNDYFDDDFDDDFQ